MSVVPPNSDVIVYPDSQRLSSAAADLIVGEIEASPKDRFSLGLAGGSTPADTYRVLADGDADWRKVDAWLSDERWVPHDHEDSNGRLAARLLMDDVPATFVRPRWAPWLYAADAAAHYEAELRRLHPDGRADLIMLGMGDDGHTASLFPGTAALDAPDHRWFVSNFVPNLDADRLTATYSFLRAARHVLFLVAGPGKAAALRQVLEPADGETTLPARGVIGGDARVTWLVDEAAAAELVATPSRRAD